MISLKSLIKALGSFGERYCSDSKQYFELPANEDFVVSAQIIFIPAAPSDLVNAKELLWFASKTSTVSIFLSQ
jgi:hypothetical protein